MHKTGKGHYFLWSIDIMGL